MKYTLTFRENNSGGSWWLRDEAYLALEQAGWVVDGRHATIVTEDVEASIRQWEELTGWGASEEGCNCCGRPFNFSWEDEQGQDWKSLQVHRGRNYWTV